MTFFPVNNLNDRRSTAEGIFCCMHKRENRFQMTLLFRRGGVLEDTF